MDNRYRNEQRGSGWWPNESWDRGVRDAEQNLVPFILLFIGGMVLLPIAFLFLIGILSLVEHILTSVNGWVIWFFILSPVAAFVWWRIRHY